MGKTKSRHWFLSCGRLKGRLVEAKLYLSDAVSHGQFNAPRMVLVFQVGGGDVRVELEWQRNLQEKATEVTVPTRRAWSAPYAGHVSLSGDAARHEITARPYELGNKDAFRVAAARKIATVIQDRNLWAVYREDEIAQVKAAVEYLGGWVEVIYVEDGGRERPMRDAVSEWRESEVRS